jgi:pilus assembly protein CpaF
MFGKRTTFGGNTPGANTPAPRPTPAPVVQAASRELARSAEPKRNEEVVDVRSPEAAQRD